MEMPGACGQGQVQGPPRGHDLLLSFLTRCQLCTMAPPSPIPLRRGLGVLDQLTVSASGDRRQGS